MSPEIELLNAVASLPYAACEPQWKELLRIDEPGSSIYSRDSGHDQRRPLEEPAEPRGLYPQERHAIRYPPGNCGQAAQAEPGSAGVQPAI
jgi:hypothetical protein